MRWGLSVLAVFLSWHWSAVAFADSTFQLHYFRPSIPFAEIHSDTSLGSQTYGKNPVLAVEDGSAKLDVTGFGWEGAQLRIGSLAGSVKMGKATVNLTEPIQQFLFSYNNVQISLKSKAPIIFTLPESFALRRAVEGDRIRFVLADDTVQKSLATQIDSVFSAEKFDAAFELDIQGDFGEGETGKQIHEDFRKVVRKHLRPQLLEQVRASLKASLNDASFAEKLAIPVPKLPANVADAVSSGEDLWEFAHNRDGSLWQLAQKSAIPVATTLPPVSAERRNIVTLFVPAESVTWDETDKNLPLSDTFDLVMEGGAAPSFALWSRRHPQQTLGFADVVWNVRDLKARRDRRLGLILDLVPGKAPAVKSAFEKTEKGWGAVSNEEQRYFSEIAQPLIDKWYARFQIVDGPTFLGMRAAGQGSARAQSNEGWVSHFALDYALK